MLQGLAEVHSLDEFPEVPEIEETGTTFADNALLKAETVARFTGLAALADDSGLVVDALNGAPGVHSARFAGPGATDESNRVKLLELLRDVPVERRGARFICAVTIVIPGKAIWTTTGKHEGRITLEPRGASGFGYDPLFFSFELGATFAEVPEEQKNTVSHRGRAMANVHKYLRGES